MKIYLDQIPDGITVDDYPEGTEFVLDDSRFERDPVTHKLILKEKRPLVFPSDLK